MTIQLFLLSAHCRTYYQRNEDINLAGFWPILQSSWDSDKRFFPSLLFAAFCLKCALLGIYFQNLVKETWQSCLTVEQNYLADPRAKIID